MRPARPPSPCVAPEWAEAKHLWTCSRWCGGLGEQAGRRGARNLLHARTLQRARRTPQTSSCKLARYDQ
eukprot:4327940-Pleurochrysis_carterae.AAC.2